MEKSQHPIIPEEILFEEILNSHINLRNFNAICSSNHKFQKLCDDDNFW